MGFQKHMIRGAEKATGEEIQAAGLFQRKGAERKVATREAAGLATGAVVDSDQMFNIGAAGSAAGGAVEGSAEGRSVAQAALQGTSFVVALSQSGIHILRPTEFRGISHEKLELLHTFPRRQVKVQSKSGVMVRTLGITDPQTGAHVELESERNWKAHGKPVISTLVAESV